MFSILLTDDDEGVRTALRLNLEAAGYQVKEARGGREALELYRQAPTDVVVTDILMPDTDGLEATLVLAREYPDAKIIAMTGASGKTNFLDVAKLFGAQKVLQKPFPMEELLHAIRDVLKST
jgi:two-component system response regulator (stage 0 sporulation protein F)